MSSSGDESARVSKYFHEHAVDFDTIYAEERKGPLRKLRDRLSRGTVVGRLPFVMERAATWKPATVLDVGCGSGRFSVPLAKEGATVIGLDFAPDMIELAKKMAADAGVGDRCTFLTDDILAWDPPHKSEMTIGIGLLDYIADAERMVERLVAATDGHLIISFPKRYHALVPLRFVRLRAAGCPVYFYSKADVDRLGRLAGGSYEIVDFHRDHLLVASTG
jgi:SAM-dependent methyltransferase